MYPEVLRYTAQCAMQSRICRIHDRGSRRHSEASELEQVGRVFWNSLFGASSKAKLPIQSATG